MKVISNEYMNYINNNILFCSNVVVKYGLFADIINRHQENNFRRTGNVDYIVDINNKKSWKYYLNISGEYHKTDKHIYTVSNDTKEYILLSKEVIKNHPLTREYLKFNGRGYKLLLIEHPESSLLINGILNPCNIDQAVNSKNGTILSYDKTFIEPNEINIMDELNRTSINYFNIHHNKFYYSTDELYPQAFMMGLSFNMFNKLITLRLNNIKTTRVHSFHLEEYFRSNNSIVNYNKYLTNNQKLYFYFNRNHIVKNLGSEYSFNLLKEQILGVRKIPLLQHSIKKVLADKNIKLNNGKHLAIKNTYSEITNINYLKKPVERSIDILINETNQLVTGNVNENSMLLKEELSNISTNKVKTKYLETVINVSDNHRIINDKSFILDQCFYLSHSKKYNNYISYANSNKGIKADIKIIDAMYIILYIISKLNGVKLTTVPDHYIDGVYTGKDSTLDRIKLLKGKLLITKHYVIDALTEDLLIIPEINNSIAFKNYSLAIYGNIKAKLINANIGDDVVVNSVAMKVYNTIFPKIKLGSTNELYSDLLTRAGLNLTSFSNRELIELTNSLIVECTLFKNDKLENENRTLIALTGMIRSLCSYNIEFINKNSNNIDLIETLILQKIGIIKHKSTTVSRDFFDQRSNIYFRERIMNNKALLLFPTAVRINSPVNIKMEKVKLTTKINLHTNTNEYKKIFISNNITLTPRE